MSRPTKRMLSALGFCESILHIEFEGDKNSFTEVSAFLSDYLDAAKATWDDAVSSYYSNFDY